MNIEQTIVAWNNIKIRYMHRLQEHPTDGLERDLFSYEPHITSPGLPGMDIEGVGPDFNFSGVKPVKVIYNGVA